MKVKTKIYRDFYKEKVVVEAQENDDMMQPTTHIYKPTGKKEEGLYEYIYQGSSGWHEAK